MLSIITILPMALFSMNEETHILMNDQPHNNREYNYKKTLSGHSDSINAAFFDSNEVLYSASEDKTIKKYSLHNDQNTTYQQPDKPKIIDGNQEDTHLAIGHEQGIVTIFNKQNGTQKKRYDGLKAPIFALAFHPQDDSVAFGECAMDGNGIKLWNIKAERPGAILNSSLKLLTSLAFSSVNLNTMVTASYATCKIWDINQQKTITSIDCGNVLPWVTYHRAKDLFALSVQTTKKIFLGDSKEKKCKEIVLKGSGKHSRLQRMEFNGDNTILLGFTDGVETLDLRNKAIIHKFPTVIYPTVSCCCGGKSITVDKDTHESTIRALAVSKDNSQFATCSADTTIKIWKNN